MSILVENYDKRTPDHLGTIATISWDDFGIIQSEVSTMAHVLKRDGQIQEPRFYGLALPFIRKQLSRFEKMVTSEQQGALTLVQQRDAYVQAEARDVCPIFADFARVEFAGRQRSEAEVLDARVEAFNIAKAISKGLNEAYLRNERVYILH